MKRGPKPKGKVQISWSPKFAYAIGLITADGNLSNDGRHISLTSKDRVQVDAFKKCLGLTNKVSTKFSGHGSSCFHVQFGDVLFYRFLMQIGLSPAKSNTLLSVDVPSAYFIDFLRGYFDGDGCSYSYQDPVWKNSYRFYISFTSGSESYIQWLRTMIAEHLGVKGYISRNKNYPYLQLKFAKKDAVI